MNRLLSNTAMMVLLSVMILMPACKKQFDQPLPEAAEEKLAQKAAICEGETTPVVMEFEETISGEYERERLQQSLTASDFTPTGLYVPPNSNLKIKVEQLSGTEMPTVIFGTYSRYTSRIDPYEFPLYEGEQNISANEESGMLYIRFGTSGTPTSRVRVTFLEGFVQVPVYTLGTTNAQDWATQLHTLPPTPDVIMISNKAILVFSRERAKKHIFDNHDYILRTIDNVIEAENYISGLDGSAPEHKTNKHKLMLTETDDVNAWMYANHHRTAYTTAAAKYAFTRLVGSSEGWGPWHELGHMHQQPAWTWDAVLEVTVNVYSMAAERALRITPNRLAVDGVWPQVQRYFALPGRDYNNDEQASLFVRLCMFEQLRQAFGDKFYIQLHKETRIEKPTPQTTAEKMRYFMLKACTISGYDLTRFFRKWGFKDVESAFAEIASLRLPPPPVEPDTYNG